MTNDKTTTTIKEIMLQNLPLAFAVVVTIANLYIASLLSPIKSDINALARGLDEIQRNGTIKSQINDVRIQNVEGNIVEIKSGIISLNDKVDRLSER